MDPVALRSALACHVPSRPDLPRPALPHPLRPDRADPL